MTVILSTRQKRSSETNKALKPFTIMVFWQWSDSEYIDI